MLPETAPASIAVDPKTDDLVVLDNPDQCAGGIEGQMTIYPKPYRTMTARQVDLNGNCVGAMRLDATSSTVFALDVPYATLRTRIGLPDSAYGYVIIQRSYPDGRDMGKYRRGDPVRFTTIPNTLPN